MAETEERKESSGRLARCDPLLWCLKDRTAHKLVNCGYRLGHQTGAACWGEEDPLLVR